MATINIFFLTSSQPIHLGTATPATMKHWYHSPNPLLSACISTVLVMEGFSAPDPNAKPVFTNGLPMLLCRTEKAASGQEELQQLALFDQSVRAEDLVPDENTTIIAFFFRPFEMACLFNIAAATLLQAPFALGQWDAHKVNVLRTQLLYARTTIQKTEALEHLLLQQLQEQQRICDVIRFATDRLMYQSGTDALTELLAELDLNERTFQRLFKKYVGVTPTQYRRACQFHFAFGQLHANQFDKISDVAFDSGFSDQSHFIRSFKEFTETTPNHYLKKGLKGKKA